MEAGLRRRIRRQSQRKDPDYRIEPSPARWFNASEPEISAVWHPRKQKPQKTRFLAWGTGFSLRQPYFSQRQSQISLWQNQETLGIMPKTLGKTRFSQRKTEITQGENEFSQRKTDFSLWKSEIPNGKNAQPPIRTLRRYPIALSLLGANHMVRHDCPEISPVLHFGNDSCLPVLLRQPRNLCRRWIRAARVNRASSRFWRKRTSLLQSLT